MTIFRKAHKNKYTCLGNQLLQNNALTLRARGLMAYLLSLPDDWEVHITHLVNVMVEGRHVIRETILELKDAGYIHHHKLGFKDGWRYYVFEEPCSPEEFKEFLRTIENSDSSDSVQFGGTPLQNTNNLDIQKKQNKDKKGGCLSLSHTEKEKSKPCPDSVAVEHWNALIGYLELHEIRLEATMLKAWIEKYGMNRLMSNLTLLVREKHRIKNPVAWLRVALAHDYAESARNIDTNRQYAQEFKEKYRWHDLEITKQYCTIKRIAYDIQFRFPPEQFKAMLHSKYNNLFNDKDLD